MSPTSYLTAPPRDVVSAGAERGTRTRTDKRPQDFKSRVSTNSTSPATLEHYTIFYRYVKLFFQPLRNSGPRSEMSAIGP